MNAGGEAHIKGMLAGEEEDRRKKVKGKRDIHYLKWPKEKEKQPRKLGLPTSLILRDFRSGVNGVNETSLQKLERRGENAGSSISKNKQHNQELQGRGTA